MFSFGGKNRRCSHGVVVKQRSEMSGIHVIRRRAINPNPCWKQPRALRMDAWTAEGAACAGAGEVQSAATMWRFVFSDPVDSGPCVALNYSEGAQLAKTRILGMQP